MLAALPRIASVGGLLAALMNRAGALCIRYALFYRFTECSRICIYLLQMIHVYSMLYK